MRDGGLALRKSTSVSESLRDFTRVIIWDTDTMDVSGCVWVFVCISRKCIIEDKTKQNIA